MTKRKSFPSMAIWWDAGKARLKRLIRQYSKQQASSRRSRVTSLENTLFHLNRRQTHGEDVTQFIKEVNDELELEHLRTAHGVRIRAREKWAEEGEKSTSYFLRQERTRGVRKLFTGIRNAQGVVVRSITAIIRVWCIFYVQLFTAAVLSSSDQDFFINSLDLHLSDPEAALCEGDISEAECLSALNSMKNNKSPGIDGLPYEFYKRFWNLLGTDLVAVLNYCSSSGSLSFSQRMGLITLLYKKNDKLDTKNWRPISLLCTDYKILSKVLTNRLRSVISSVVSDAQACGIPNRFSSEHVRLLQDVIDYSNHNNLGGALVSLDQEKAFDRVDWPFMLRVLQKMNFGPFCSWVKLLYSDIFSRVLVNGYVSDAFKVTRGVRQGCPLSPLLYILVAETIASAIKKDINIDGFTLMNGQCIKICQYADDTSIFVMSDRALLALFALFERFEHASGAKLNVNKSHGLLFGSWKDRVDMPIHLNWSNISITVLGCRLSNDGKTDWDSLVEKFQDQLLLWKQRQLSFRGRALVANVLGLSLLWYQAQIFDVPKTVIFKVNKILFPFVWGKKREWMARTSVIQPMVDGGLGVVDISKKILSFRAVWLCRFLSNSPHPWSVFFNHYVSLHFRNAAVADVLVRDTIPAYLVKKLPPFYASLLRVWIDLKGNQNSGMWVIPRPSGALLPVEELTAKKAYTFLLNYHHVEHRSLAKFQDLGFTVQWKHVWASLTLWRFVRSVQDTAWLSFHGILPTTDRLARFGMNVNPFCFCGQHKSLLHLLTACAFATEVLDWFVSQLRKFNNLAVLSDCEILFGFLPSSDVPVVFTALLGVLRHHI